MKKIFLFLLSLNTINLLAQEKFSKEVEVISDIVKKQISGPSALAKLGPDTIGYKVAIVSIENEDKKNTKLTELIENKIAINLAMESNGKYDILDRNYIEKLMKEKNIPLDYDNKRDFAKNIGRVKAANFIIVGTLTAFENDFELNLQIIETKEGNTIGGATGSITATQLLREKNEDNSQKVRASKNSSNGQAQNETPAEIKPVATPKATTGTVEINSKVSSTLVILMGTEVVEPSNFGKQYEELTLGPNSTDKFEGLAPGVYYICATHGRHDFRGCVYSKKVVVEAGKNVVVRINSLSHF